MLLRLLICVLFAMTLASCSGSGATEEISSTEGIELIEGDDDLFESNERTVLDTGSNSGVNIDDLEVEGIDSIALDSGVSSSSPNEIQFVETQPVVNDPYREGEELNAQVNVGSGVEVAPSDPSSSINYSSQGTAIYKVRKNETLMLIAFKLYGDYSRWRELASLNKGLARSGNMVPAGARIRYNKSGAGFDFNPRGESYLIKQRDTLGKISNKVYGNFNKWRRIYNNNRPLIKNPNLIFAGFTIYYPVQ